MKGGQNINFDVEKVILKCTEVSHAHQVTQEVISKAVDDRIGELESQIGFKVTKPYQSVLQKYKVLISFRIYIKL